MTRRKRLENLERSQALHAPRKDQRGPLSPRVLEAARCAAERKLADLPENHPERQVLEAALEEIRLAMAAAPPAA